MPKIEQSAVSLANAFVQRVEQRGIEKLGLKALQEEQRGKICGCRSCRHGAEETSRNYWTEYFRVYGDGIDHEEEFILNKAGSKHIEGWNK